MESKRLALLCRKLADSKKAEDIVVLDMREVSSISDFFVISSGTSEPHLRAISEEIQQQLRQGHGLRPRTVDGSAESAWIVLDYFDVIVHIMKPDLRRHYDLEALWGDATRLRAPRGGSSLRSARSRG